MGQKGTGVGGVDVWCKSMPGRYDWSVPLR